MKRREASEARSEERGEQRLAKHKDDAPSHLLVVVVVLAGGSPFPSSERLVDPLEREGSVGVSGEGGEGVLGRWV